MHDILPHIAQALVMAAGMAWKVGWSLVLGFFISAVLQVMVSKQRIEKTLGGEGLRPIVLATIAGATSSSCSYASAAVSRTLLQKGAGFAPALAFLVSSTNLVIELGLVLYLLLGWQFVAGEWLGGIALIAIMAVLLRLTYPHKLIAAARRQKNLAAGHDHAAMQAAKPSLRDPQTRLVIAHGFAMDWSMLWKDIVLGFLIAGALAAFVPDGVWQALFVRSAPPLVQVPANALLGPLVAVFSFVCSIGNVPMAAVLWGSGVSFGGVLAFLYADLIVLPLLDVYRRQYGWKMAAYIGGVFYITMSLGAMLVDVVFSKLGWVPARNINIRAEMTIFSFDYTFWLNLAFGGLAIYLMVLVRRAPKVIMASCCHY